MGRPVVIADPVQTAAARAPIAQPNEHAARRTLRDQIARLEAELADAFVTAFPMGGLQTEPASSGHPRLLDLGELERVRDGLADRLHRARASIARHADEQEAKRVLLERMLLDPGSYRFVRISRSELGEPGCGAWEVRPRLGLIGMLMGWWQVKLSSGCPLPGGRGPAAARSSRDEGSAEPRRPGGARRADHVHRQPRPLGRDTAALAVGWVADPGRDRVARSRAAGDVRRGAALGGCARLGAGQAERPLPRHPAGPR